MKADHSHQRERLRMSDMVAQRCDIVDDVYLEFMGNINGAMCQSVRQSWLKHGPRANRFDGINVYIRLLGDTIPSESTRRHFIETARERHRNFELSLTLPVRKGAKSNKSRTSTGRFGLSRLLGKGKAGTPSNERPVERDETLRDYVIGVRFDRDIGGRP